MFPMAVSGKGNGTDFCDGTSAHCLCAKSDHELLMTLVPCPLYSTRLIRGANCGLTADGKTLWAPLGVPGVCQGAQPIVCQMVARWPSVCRS